MNESSVRPIPALSFPITRAVPVGSSNRIVSLELGSPMSEERNLEPLRSGQAGIIYTGYYVMRGVIDEVGERTAVFRGLTLHHADSLHDPPILERVAQWHLTVGPGEEIPFMAPPDWDPPFR